MDFKSDKHPRGNLVVTNHFRHIIGKSLKDIFRYLSGVPKDLLYSLIPALWIILIFANDNFGRFALNDPHCLYVDDNVHYTTWTLMVQGWGFYDAFLFAFRSWSISGGIPAMYRGPLLFQLWAVFSYVAQIKVLYFLLGSTAMLAAFFMTRKIGGNAAYGVLSMLFLLEVIPTRTWFMIERWAIAVGIIGLYFFVSDSSVLASSLFFLSFSFKEVMFPLSLFAFLYAILFKRRDHRSLIAYTLGLVSCIIYITIHNLLVGYFTLGNYYRGLWIPYFSIDSGTSFSLSLRGWGDLSLLSTIFAFLGMTAIKDEKKKLFFLSASLFSHLFIAKTIELHRYLAPAVALEVPMVPLIWKTLLTPLGQRGNQGQTRETSSSEEPTSH